MGSEKSVRIVDDSADPRSRHHPNTSIRLLRYCYTSLFVYSFHVDSETIMFVYNHHPKPTRVLILICRYTFSIGLCWDGS